MKEVWTCSEARTSGMPKWLNLNYEVEDRFEDFKPKYLSSSWEQTPEFLNSNMRRIMENSFYGINPTEPITVVPGCNCMICKKNRLYKEQLKELEQKESLKQLTNLINEKESKMTMNMPNKTYDHTYSREKLANTIIIHDGVMYKPEYISAKNVTYGAENPTLDIKCTVTPSRVVGAYDKDRCVPQIKSVTFNDPATIVFWKDGTKTVVKADNEAFDPEKGIAMAIAKKVLGNQGNYFNTIRKAIKNATFESKKTKKKEKVTEVVEEKEG